MKSLYRGTESYIYHSIGCKHIDKMVIGLNVISVF